MKRLIENDLHAWKQTRGRKPLLLKGARQVGKTFVVREFGKGFSSYVEVNFEKAKDIKKIFNENLDPKRLLRDISLITKKNITPGETLLFLDEIQECPDAIKALRYFYEDIPELHVIGAGSLIEFELEKIGIPVGRVSVNYMYPLSFLEFLMGAGYEDYIDIIEECVTTLSINEAHHQKLLKLFSEYCAIGGMPEATRCWIESNNLTECYNILKGLIETFRQDFQKYTKKHQVKYIEKLFNEIPLMAGKKFKFSNLSGEYRKRELSPALDLLSKAGIIHTVCHSPSQGTPLGAGANLDRFKLIFLDISLMQVILNLDPVRWILDGIDAIINKGELAEVFVGQELIAYSDIHMKAQLHYWHRESSSSNAEIDYVIACNNTIIPIEVKSGSAGALRSMHIFLREHPHTPFGIRLYHGMPNRSDNIVSLPLYCVSKINTLFHRL